MDDDSVLIEPRRVPGDPEINHPVILVLYGPYLDILRKELKIRKAALSQLRFPSMTYFSACKNGSPISACGTPLGAPQAALILERLIAMGAKEILAFGCCGSLQPDLKVGDVVIPTAALTEEGTSAHYVLPPGVAAAPDANIAGACDRECREKGLRAVCGRVWTTDALFRETRGKAKRYAQMGLLAVEMEMSALFTVAAYRKVRLGGLMVVSDELGTLKWKPGFLNPKFWLASKKAAGLAIEVCRRF